METSKLKNETEEVIRIIIGFEDKAGTLVPISKFIKPQDEVELPYELALIAQKKGLVGEVVEPIEEEEKADEKKEVKVEPPHIVPKKEKADYSKESAETLRKILEERGVQTLSSMKKKELIGLLKDDDDKKPPEAILDDSKTNEPI